MPGDFGLVAAYGFGARNVLDTFGATFTKDLVSSTYPDRRHDTPPADSRLREIYGLLREMGATAYPVEYVPPDTGSYGTLFQLLPALPRGWPADRDPVGELQLLPGEAGARPLAGHGEDPELIEATDEYKALPPALGGYVSPR